MGDWSFRGGKHSLMVSKTDASRLADKVGGTVPRVKAGVRMATHMASEVV